MIIDETTIIENIDENRALAVLLAEGVCFMNNVDLSIAYPEYYKNENWTTIIYVLVSDIFAWACADAETISNNDNDLPSEIIELYKLYREKKFWGIVEWACMKRKIQPQFKIKEDMIKEGFWTSELELLQENK